jgi:hypothetical protein
MHQQHFHDHLLNLVVASRLEMLVFRFVHQLAFHPFVQVDPFEAGLFEAYLFWCQVAHLADEAACLLVVKKDYYPCEEHEFVVLQKDYFHGELGVVALPLAKV